MLLCLGFLIIQKTSNYLITKGPYVTVHLGGFHVMGADCALSVRGSWLHYLDFGVTALEAHQPYCPRLMGL